MGGGASFCAAGVTSNAPAPAISASKRAISAAKSSIAPNACPQQLKYVRLWQLRCVHTVHKELAAAP